MLVKEKMYTTKNGMVKYALFIVLVFSYLPLSAQEEQARTLHGGKIIDELQQNADEEGVITIHQEEGIEFLLDTQIKMNKRTKGVDGYRIQLYSGSGPKGKKEAINIRGKFLSEFPEEAVEVYTAFNPPFWRVRVGDYRHKHEALQLLNALKAKFPNCYVVKDGAVKMEKFQ